MSSPIVMPEQRGAPLLAGVPAPRTLTELLAMRRKVQVARKQLGLAEDDYRAILSRVTGKTSSKDLGPSQLDAVLAEFKRLGWKATAPAKKPGSPQQRMIMGVWADMRPYLASGDDATLRAFVRRQTKTPAHPDGVDDVRFLDAAMANRVLEGLKAWLRRLREADAALKARPR